MSAQPTTFAPGVLRGLHLESVPLRLGRAVAPAVGVPATSSEAPAAAAHEENLRLAREQAVREGREQGMRTGHEEGLRQGRAAAAAETRLSVEQAVAEAVQAVRAEHDRLRQLAGAVQVALEGATEIAHEEMVALCYETLCRIVGERAVQPEMVRSQLAHLIGLHRAREGLVLHVHPQDAELLERGAVDGSAPAGVRWAADPEVALGGCILRCATGGLDARLETMLAACKDALLQARAGPTAGHAARGEDA